GVPPAADAGLGAGKGVLARPADGAHLSRSPRGRRPHGRQPRQEPAPQAGGAGPGAGPDPVRVRRGLPLRAPRVTPRVLHIYSTFSTHGPPNLETVQDRFLP